MYCEEVILGSTEFYVQDGSGNLIPPPLFGNSICPQDCNGNGNCIGGACVCYASHEGDACYVVKGKSV